MTAIAASASSGGNVLRALALGAGFVLVLAFAWDGRRDAAPAKPVVEVVVGEWTFRAEPEVVGTLETVSRRYVADTGSGAQRQLDTMVASELDRIFAMLAARLPDYADWHYSLSGEYARLAVLMFGRTGLVDDEAIRRKAIELIFEDAGFERAIEALDARGAALLADHARAQQAAWLAEIVKALDSGSSRQQTSPTLAARLTFEPLHAGFEGLQGEAFNARLIASTGAAGVGALAAPIAARAIGRRAAIGGLRPLAGRTAARGAARAGTASGGGMLGCAATGPAAVPCMVVVGGAIWVATDLLMLGADEWLNREALIADLQHGLDEMRAELEPALMARYARAIDGWQEAMGSELARTFSPIDTISGRAVR